MYVDCAVSQTTPAVNQDQNYMNTGEEILKEETNFGAGELGERENDDATVW